MYLAIPKEDINNESRVAATPGTVKELISAGLDVYVETEAGSKGLYGATTPAKTEQRKMIKKILEEIIAIFELKKL